MCVFMVELGMDISAKKQTYLKLREKMISCTNCDLRKGASQVVPGAGSVNAKIMFIGEGPGANEDKQGIPFCGAAGKFLDELLGSINLNRNKIFITNIVKCRPPKNRDPQVDEIKTCTKWLDKQIEIIQPQVIVPLGRHAMSFFLPSKTISKEHGNIYKVENRTYFVSYHPAAALYNGSLRSVMLEDFGRLRLRINNTIMEM